MRTAERTILLLGLALVCAPAAQAAGTRHPEPATPGESAADAVRGFIADRIAQGVQQLGKRLGDNGPTPQAIEPGGPEIRLDNLSRPEEIEQRIRAAAPSPSPSVRLTVPQGQARLGDFTIGSAETVQGHLLVLAGDANVYGRLLGNLVTVDGDVVLHPGGVVSGDILTLRGRVDDRGGTVDGEIRTLEAVQAYQADASNAPSALARTGQHLAGVLAVFVTLLALGAGLVLFARTNLEVVADTVSHSFGRAFITGLLGQLLLLPTFGMLVVGLVLSVAGILLLPFAVVVYALLAAAAVVGGYLAVAHAVGETYVRRRMAHGAAASPNSYRFLFVGLVALFALWAAWAVFSWVPVAGEIVRGAAIVVTWLLGTAGFGAALLSRAGLHEHFTGRLIPPEALTDEYLWATPQFGVPAVRRPDGTVVPGSRPGIRPPELER